MKKSQKKNEPVGVPLMALFAVNDKQGRKLQKFSVHKCKYWYNPGTIGGRITYSFTPTSLGVVVTASCLCGKKLNVTDYESW